MRLEKDPACPVCSQHPTQTGLIDYEALCGAAMGKEGGGDAAEAAAADEDGEDPFEIGPETLARWLSEGRELAGGIDAWSERVDPSVPRY